MSIGTVAAVTHDRTVAGSPIARTRKVTVAKIICGVDVSSKTLDARIGQDGPSRSFDRAPEGIQALAAFCKSHDVEFVAMEATGGYEKLPFSLLWLAGVPCAILNPRSVRRFAEAMGTFEKSDDIDTGVIAHFAEVKRIVPQTPASATQQELEALVTRLRQVTDLRTSQTNQRRLVTDAGVLEGIDELVALLNRQIRALEAKIAQSIDADPLWKALDPAFRSIKGVADRTVARQACRLGAARQRQWKSQRQTLDLRWPRQR